MRRRGREFREGGLKMYQAKSAENQTGGGGEGKKVKVAQNDLKHILVVDFFKSDEIFTK